MGPEIPQPCHIHRSAQCSEAYPRSAAMALKLRMSQQLLVPLY